MKRILSLLALLPVLAGCDLHLAASSSPAPDAGRVSKFSTAARRNGIADGPASAVVQIKEGHQTTDIADGAFPTPDSTFHDLVTVSITTTTGTDLSIMTSAAMTVSSTASSGLMLFQVTVDGAAVPGSGWNLTSGPYGGVITGGLGRCRVAVGAGAHTVKLQWQNSVNGSSKHLNAATNPTNEYAKMFVEEIVKS